MWDTLLENLQKGDIRSLSRTISLVENDAPGSEEFLKLLPHNKTVKIIGITGPPGAGKSTISDLLIGEYLKEGKRICILCIDPSSTLTGGALLGDRIRMHGWHSEPSVYIRSLSTKGILGGLHPLIIEITDLVKAASFDHILIETAGVGQSEIGISKLADTTIVVQVPEGGDDIQAMKAGLMEIADIFVVNKCDRAGADVFVNHLKSTARHVGKDTPVVKMTATLKEGITELRQTIDEQLRHHDQDMEKKYSLLTEQVWQLALKKILKQIDRKEIEAEIRNSYGDPHFNLYKLVDDFV